MSIGRLKSELQTRKGVSLVIIILDWRFDIELILGHEQYSGS